MCWSETHPEAFPSHIIVLYGKADESACGCVTHAKLNIAQCFTRADVLEQGPGTGTLRYSFPASAMTLPE